MIEATFISSGFISYLHCFCWKWLAALGPMQCSLVWFFIFLFLFVRWLLHIFLCKIAQMIFRVFACCQFIAFALYLYSWSFMILFWFFGFSLCIVLNWSACWRKTRGHMPPTLNAQINWPFYEIKRTPRTHSINCSIFSLLWRKSVYKIMKLIEILFCADLHTKGGKHRTAWQMKFKQMERNPIKSKLNTGSIVLICIETSSILCWPHTF